MSVRQRILTVRLMEKLSSHPAYAAALGIAWTQDPADPEEPP